MMKNQLAGLMKQAQQMQDNLKRAQEELAQLEVEGQSGAGLVKVVMTCRHDVKRVSIDPSLVGEDRDMLEDLVAAAFNDAVRRVEATTQEKLAGFAGGMGGGIPRRAVRARRRRAVRRPRASRIDQAAARGRGADTMMKNQLAGLMKQAQQMQDNLKRAQEELAQLEVEGQSGRGAGQGRDDLPARRQARVDRSVARRRGPRHARGPGRRRVQRRGAARRGDDAGEARGLRRRHGHAARDSRCRSESRDRAHARRPAGARGRAAVEPRRPRPRAAVPAGGRAEGRAAHGAPSAAARPRGRPGARPGARARGAARAPLRALQHLHRGGDLRAVPLRQARPVAPLRRRDARRSPHDGADPRLHGAVLRADGAPVAARRHRSRARFASTG